MAVRIRLDEQLLSNGLTIIIYQIAMYQDCISYFLYARTESKIK